MVKLIIPKWSTSFVPFKYNLHFKSSTWTQGPQTFKKKAFEIGGISTPPSMPGKWQVRCSVQPTLHTIVSTSADQPLPSNPLPDLLLRWSANCFVQCTPILEPLVAPQWVDQLHLWLVWGSRGPLQPGIDRQIRYKCGRLWTDMNNTDEYCGWGVVEDSKRFENERVNNLSYFSCPFYLILARIII